MANKSRPNKKNNKGKSKKTGSLKKPSSTSTSTSSPESSTPRTSLSSTVDEQGQSLQASDVKSFDSTKPMANSDLSAQGDEDQELSPSIAQSINSLSSSIVHVTYPDPRDAASAEIDSAHSSNPSSGLVGLDRDVLASVASESSPYTQAQVHASTIKDPQNSSKAFDSDSDSGNFQSESHATTVDNQFHHVGNSDVSGVNTKNFNRRDTAGNTQTFASPQLNSTSSSSSSSSKVTSIDKKPTTGSMKPSDSQKSENTISAARDSSGLKSPVLNASTPKLSPLSTSSSPRAGFGSAPSSPRPLGNTPAAVAIHRMLTPETPVVSRSRTGSPATSVVGSRSSSPMPSMSRNQSNLGGSFDISTSDSLSQQQTDLSSKVPLSPNVSGGHPLSGHPTPHFSRMYYSRNGSNSSIASIASSPHQHPTHLNLGGIGDVSNSLSETATTLLSPSSSSLMLASMDMTSEAPGGSNTGVMTPTTDARLSSNIAVGESAASSTYITKEKRHNAKSLLPSLSSSSLTASNLSTLDNIRPARRNLSIHDLTRLVATENLETAGLASYFLSPALAAENKIAHQDSAASLASLASSSTHSGPDGNVPTSVLASASGSTGINPARPQPLRQTSFGATNAADIGGSHGHAHATPGRRLPSRKSLTTLARPNTISAAELTSPSRETPKSSDMTRNKKLGRAASTTNLHNHRSTHYKNPHHKSGLALSSSHSPNSRHISRNGTLNIETSGIGITTFQDNEITETVLSPLLVRTGSKVWEDIRESKGHSWLAGRSPSNTFMHEEDEEEERIPRNVSGYFARKEQLAREAEKQVAQEGEYNPLTYQSRTMVGVEIDDRYSDTQSEAEVIQRYVVSDSASEDNEKGQQETLKKKASFKLAVSSSQGTQGSDEDEDEDDYDAVLHMDDLKRLKKQDNGKEQKRRVQLQDHNGQILDNSSSDANTDQTVSSGLGDSTYAVIGDDSSSPIPYNTLSDDVRSSSAENLISQYRNEEEYYGDSEEDSSSEFDDYDSELEDDDYDFDKTGDLIEPSHNLFIEIVDWVLGIGHEGVPFSVPTGSNSDTNKAGDDISKPLKSSKDKKKRKLSRQMRAQRQAKRDLEQGLNFDVALALGYAAFML